MTYILLALTFAALESFALWKQHRPVEFVAKPAVMVTLFLYLVRSVGLHDAGLWFGLGILFSLIGDILLLWLDRFFLFGLAAFLLGHISYIIGFNLPPSPFTGWSAIMAIIVGLGGVRLIRRITVALITKGQARLRLPVTVYGFVISLMLLSAMLKLTDTAWDAGAALAVGAGAFLFLVSDVVLAWNKFVTPIHNGRILNIGLYHLGQILLVAGIVMQFKP